MHESSLAQNILAVVLQKAEEASARRVIAVKGWVAETEALHPASLDFHFQARAVGTPAEGAKLELRCVHVEAKCTQCATVFLPDHHVLLCSNCGSTAAQLLGPTGVAVETMQVE